MEQVIDLYETSVPNHSLHNGRTPYASRLIWCAMYYMDQRLFCAHDLSLLIEEIYGEKLSAAKVSHGLKDFVQLGKVERINHRNRSVRYYNYRVSQSGAQYMQREDVVN